MLNFIRTQALAFTVFDKTQQFRLDRQRQFADFIQKKGALVGPLNIAVLAFVGTGEGPLLVPEQQ